MRLSSVVSSLVFALFLVACAPDEGGGPAGQSGTDGTDAPDGTDGSGVTDGTADSAVTYYRDVEPVLQHQE